MSEQFDLLDIFNRTSAFYGELPPLPPAAAKADPASSHLAARELARSGARRRQVELVAALVRQHPGCTSLELAEATGRDRHMLAKRLPDAAACGLVRKVTRWNWAGEEVPALRKCKVSWRVACQWVPVP